MASVSNVLRTSAPTQSPHVCPYKTCRKVFSKKYNLKAHLRMHTGEMPFVCTRPGCSKKFKWRSSLSSHTIWHERQEAGEEDGEAGGSSAEAKKETQVATGTKKSDEERSSQKKKRPRTTTLDIKTPTTSNITDGQSCCSTINRKRSYSEASDSGSKTHSTHTSKESPTKKTKSNPILKSGPTESISVYNAVPSTNLADSSIFPAKPQVEIPAPVQIAVKADIQVNACSPLFTPSTPATQKATTTSIPPTPCPPISSENTTSLSEVSLASLSFLDNLNDAVIDPTTISPTFKKTNTVPLGSGILAQCASPSCAKMNPVNDSFDDFELESLQSFYDREEESS